MGLWRREMKRTDLSEDLSVDGDNIKMVLKDETNSADCNSLRPETSSGIL
jgi:hypothetical protein